MSAAAAASDHGHDDHGHHEESFIQKYFFTIDHKMIAKQFLFCGILLFIVGGLLAHRCTLATGLARHGYSNLRQVFAGELLCLDDHACFGHDLFGHHPFAGWLLRQLVHPADGRGA